MSSTTTGTDDPSNVSRHSARTPLAVAAARLPAPLPGALALMGGTAVVGVFVSLAIPLVTKAMIDGPITEHRSGAILPLGLLALALGSPRPG